MKKNNDKLKKNPERRFKFQIISAITAGLVIIFILSIYAIYQTHYQHIVEKVDSSVRGTVNLYNQTIEMESNQIAAVLEVIVEDKLLIDALMRRDRTELMSKSSALFNMLKERYSITHFYFTDSDRVNIARIHNSIVYGDTINRFTTMEAERTKKLFSGVEMGASGMFTLRVVKPIFDGDKLIGYVELGREIRHIINDVSHILKVDIYVTLNKVSINRIEWEKGMHQMGENTQWEQFPDLLLINSTTQSPTINQIVYNRLSLTKAHVNLDGTTKRILKESYQDSTFAASDSKFIVFASLYDVLDNDIGDLVIYLDFTKMTQMAVDNTIKFAIAGILVLSTILIFIFLVLSRIQGSITSYQENILKEARLREEVQQEHIKSMNAKAIEIEEQGNRMSAIIDKAVDGIITIDSQALITSFNYAAGRIFSYSPEEIIGKNLNILMPEPDQSQAIGYLKHYLQSGQRHIMLKPREVFGLTKEGKKVPLLLSVSEVIMKGEQTFVGIVHDISDRKRAETAMLLRNESLERSNKDLENFAYVASHDLQEPLRKIRAFGDRLQHQAGEQLDEKSHDYLGRMLNAATRMQTLIGDLLSFSRLDTSSKSLKKINLGDIVSGVVTDLETLIEETHATVTIGELPTLEADALQMRQLFQNLIGNAIKFKQEDVPPVVTINSQLLAKIIGSSKYIEVPQWEIMVKDNGIGLDDKYNTKIFEVFQRLHNRDTYDGTGIGLAICRKIVERHDGTISVSSKPDEGAIFRVVLPEKHDAI